MQAQVPVRGKSLLTERREIAVNILWFVLILVKVNRVETSVRLTLSTVADVNYLTTCGVHAFYVA